MSQFEKVRSKTPFLYLLSHLIFNKDAFTNSIETCWFRADDLTGKQVQNEVKCSTFDMEMVFILVQIKLIFTKKVVHLASFWKWGYLELRSGLLHFWLSPSAKQYRNDTNINKKFAL